MKASSPEFEVVIIVAKIAALVLIASLVWNSWFAHQPVGMRKQDFEEARWLITTAAVASSAAVLLLTRRNIIRVLINTPVLLATTLFGIVVALAAAGGVLDAVPRIWSLVIIGGTGGALVGHILLVIGWASAKWLRWRRADDRGPPAETRIPTWRWESNGSDAC
jgi:hypothetical protein